MAIRKKQGPTLMEISADELEICSRVQRSIEQAHVKKLARTWDDSLVGFLTVSYRDGHFYVVDGQQRLYTKVHALKDPQYKFTVAMYDDLTEKDEGRMFLALNRDHKNVSTYDRYRVAVNIGEPIESAVDKLVIGLGYKVGYRSTQHTIGLPATLVRMYNQVGAKNLSTALEITAACYGGSDDPWNATVVEGLGLFLHRYGKEADMDRVLKVLRKIPVFHLVQQARTATANNRPVGTMAEIIKDRYNHGLRTNRLAA